MKNSNYNKKNFKNFKQYLLDLECFEVPSCLGRKPTKDETTLIKNHIEAQKLIKKCNNFSDLQRVWNKVMKLDSSYVDLDICYEFAESIGEF